MRNSPFNAFLIDCVSRTILYRNKIWLCQIRLTFIAVFTSIHCVKPALPAKLILLTLTLLMEGPVGDTDRAG